MYRVLSMLRAHVAATAHWLTSWDKKRQAIPPAERKLHVDFDPPAPARYRPHRPRKHLHGGRRCGVAPEPVVIVQRRADKDHPWRHLHSLYGDRDQRFQEALKRQADAQKKFVGQQISMLVMNKFPDLPVRVFA